MPSNAIDPRHTWAWQKRRAEVIRAARAAGLPCAACGQPIDYAASGRTRWGPHVDHIAALILGGEAIPPVADLRVMHAKCNASAGAKLARPAGRRRARPKPISYSSPRW